MLYVLHHVLRYLFFLSNRFRLRNFFARLQTASAKFGFFAVDLGRLQIQILPLQSLAVGMRSFRAPGRTLAANITTFGHKI